MAPNLLILGGTAEASALADRVAKAGLNATFSYAGRVAVPDAQPIRTRVGGFGGVTGLVAYLRDQGVSHVIDATHPFAAQMSRNALAASDATGVPLIALQRPPWGMAPGDNWQRVSCIQSAVEVLDPEPKSVFLAIGRTEIEAFAAAPHHHYLLRFVDAPMSTPPVPNHEVVVARGPFDVAGDTALLKRHQIDLVVSKNSGGSGARAKIDAARALGVPVLMIDRPVLPTRHEVATVDAVMDWITHSGTERGV